MRTESTSEKNTSPGIVPAAPWRLIKVKPLMDYKLEVCFMDGTHGFVDMKHLIMGHKAGVFTVLRDKKIFDQVCLEAGVVTWLSEIDLAPDAMYQEIKKKGMWIL